MIHEDHLAICKALVAGESDGRLYPEERASLAALLATFERLAAYPAIYAIAWRVAGDDRLRVSSYNHRDRASAEREMLRPEMVVPLTLTAMIEDESEASDVR